MKRFVHVTLRSAGLVFLVFVPATLTAQPRFDAQGIVYSARVGGGSVAVTPSGEVLVLEAGPSPDAPSTPGVWVVKLDHDARTVRYRSFLGHGVGSGLAADATGNVYVTGTANKGDFPQTGSFTTPATLRAAFVVKLDPDGNHVYSVLVGGADSIGRAIAVDAGGNAYVTGTTTSADFPTTAGAYDRTLNGPDQGPADAFVFKLNAQASALSYSTYLGGTGAEDSVAIALDAAGNAFVAGSTFSQDFPTTPGALQPTAVVPTEERWSDAFLTKLNSTGTALHYSTYVSGPYMDYGRAVAVNDAGEAYFAIQTWSDGLPVTPGAAQTHPVQYDAYVIKLNIAGSAPVYGTYLGGTDFENVGGIALDADGNAVVTGSTLVYSFPTTPGAVLTSTDPNSDQADAFVTTLNQVGGLVYSTLLGGSGGDEFGVGVAVGANGDLYISGGGAGIGFLYTPGTVVTPGTVTPYAGQPSTRPFVTRLVPRVSRTRGASASSEASTAFSAAAVVDAAFNTRWASAGFDSEWVAVDLGQPVEVDRVVVHWAGDAFPRQYEIQVSADLSRWDPLFVGASDGGIDDARGVRTGRYVRIYCTQPNDASPFSIWEVDVYGDPVGAANQPPTVAITYPPDGWTFIGPATFEVAVEAKDPDGTIRQVDFFIDDVFVGADTVPPYRHAVTWAEATRTSRIRAVAHDNIGATSSATATIHQEALPTSWSNSDVGTTGRAGRASLMDGRTVLDAAGSDVWGAADAFYFMRRTLNGDGDVIARVDGIQKPADAVFALAGVMFRESMAAGSRHAALVITTEGKAKFRRRTTTGGTTLSDGPSSGTTFPPRWLKLSRQGNVFSAYVSTNGTTWTPVHSPQTIAMPTTLEVGILALRNGGAGLAQATFSNVSVTGRLPAAWTDTDIGAVGVTGSAVETNGTFTVRGAGADVWGTADAFHYVYQPLVGDSAIVARVATISGTQAWTKVGVMIRGSTDPGAPYAFMLVSVGKGLAFQARRAPGASATNTSGGSGTAPRWVKLVRRGSTIVASVSTDGAAWAEVGRDTFTMTSTALIGLAVSSHTTTGLAAATFDHVAITAGPTSDLVITVPAPGATLRTKDVTFQWTGQGDEFWLDIGSAPGASDIWASASLGRATQHIVSGLPLNGMTLYVQLRRRVGAVTDVVNVQYTAAIRKALAVITDFADRRLEDYTGAGMTNVEDVSVVLRSMEAHWGWLSRGLERIQWDTVRVTLSQRCVADAFSGWPEFRSAVASLIRQQVNVADYDVQGDGTIDEAWLIVSSGGPTPETGCAKEIGPWALGGASANGGVAMFVDGQASDSVIAGAIGNFNHELGHLMGLVDMYGPYDTVHGLTVMSFSWPVPPHDFAAYERIKLGWLRPQLLTETTRNVWLPSAHETFAAVKIPTARPEEYFLIEYRKRPASGYGSQNPYFNGLAVYHVLEGSSMWQDPPIVKLEPADGSITPADGLNEIDFVYPENPALLRPMVVRSYFGNTPEVFRIENVSWRDGGLAFDVVVAPREVQTAGATPE